MQEFFRIDVSLSTLLSLPSLHAKCEKKTAEDHGIFRIEEQKERIRIRFKSDKPKMNPLEIQAAYKDAVALRTRKSDVPFFRDYYPTLVRDAIIMHKKEKLFACMKLYLESRKTNMLPNIDLLGAIGETTLFDDVDDKELSFLIACGVDQNKQGWRRMSTSRGNVLHFAVESGRVQTVQALCEFLDTSKDERNSYGMAPLHLAVMLKDKKRAWKIIATLLKSGAEPNIAVATNGKTPLHLAMEKEHFNKETVGLIIESPRIDVNRNTYTKESPLHVGMTELLEDMIRSNTDGETSGMKGMKECTLALVQKGAKVDCATELRKRAAERFGKNCTFIEFHQELKSAQQLLKRKCSH